VTVASTLHLRLFLEGIEVPVVSASVQANPNSPAVASVQVVPLDEAMQFKPRTMVHLFFYQPREWESAPATETDEILRRRYKLLFCGEVVGFSFVRTPVSRAVVLQCVDFSSYWDACHATSIDWGPHGNAFHDDSKLTAANNALFDNLVNQQPSVILGWLGQKPQTPGLDKVSGLAGGVIRMLEAIGGVSGRAKGVNDFFTIGELRGRILAQLGAEENDNTARNLMDAQVFQQWLSNGLQNAGLQSTFRDLLKVLFQYIFYDVVPNPAPRYVPGKVDKTTTNVSLKNSARGKSIAASLDQVFELLSRVRNDIYNAQTSPYGLEDSDKSRIRSICLYIKEEEGNMNKFPPKASTPIIQKLRRARRLLESLSEAPYPKKTILLRIDEAGAELNGAKGSIQGSGEVVDSSTTYGSSARLLTQIMRPDCFYAAPPKCNVIFPEHYQQLAYDRSYLTEPTRLHLQVFSQIIGFDRLFNDNVVVPALSKDFIVKTEGPAGYRSLMKHELHVGILLRTERMPDTAAGGMTKSQSQDLASSRQGWANRAALFTFFKYRYAERTINLSGKFNPNVVCGFPALVVTAPTNVKDLNFSLGSEVGSAKKRQGLGVDEFAEKLRGKSPKQLIGMVGAVSHNIDQNGGTTTVMMHHVRQHDGQDDDFLKVKVEEETTTERLISYVLDVSAKGGDNKLMSELTPQAVRPTYSARTNFGGGTILFQKTSYNVDVGPLEKQGGGSSSTQVRSPSVSAKSSTPQDSKKPPAGTKYAKIEGVSARSDLLVPDGKVKRTVGSVGKYGNKIYAVQVLDSTVVSTEDKYKAFNQIRVFEKLPVKVRTEVPAEDMLRPKWISDAYTNKNVGTKIYTPFFGCKSIIDELDYYYQAEDLDLVSGGAGSVADVDALKREKGANDTQVKELLKGYVQGKGKISIERATDYLSYVYGVVREKSGDVNKFVETYTERPIATLEDVLGSHDLALSVKNGKIEKTAGTFGFHTLSVDPRVVSKDNPLAGLLVDPDLKVSRLGSGKEETIPKGYDVRWEKQAAVKAYVTALSGKKAFLG